MKKYLILGVMLLLIGHANAQSAKAQNGPVITFEKSTHDFGDIVQGDKVEHTFTFTNTGNEPLLITNVNVQCGCTTPIYPRDPVPPGAKAEITVGFNSAGKMGLQNKSVTLVSNAVNPEANKITFTTNVLAEKKQLPQ